MALLPKDVPAEKREEVCLAGQAGVNMAARRLDEARKAFDVLLERYPNEPNVHYSMVSFSCDKTQTSPSKNSAGNGIGTLASAGNGAAGV